MSGVLSAGREATIPNDCVAEEEPRLIESLLQQVSGLGFRGLGV